MTGDDGGCSPTPLRAVGWGKAWTAAVAASGHRGNARCATPKRRFSASSWVGSGAEPGPAGLAVALSKLRCQPALNATLKAAEEEGGGRGRGRDACDVPPVLVGHFSPPQQTSSNFWRRTSEGFAGEPSADPRRHSRPGAAAMGAEWLPVAICVTLGTLHGAVTASPFPMQDRDNPTPEALHQSDELNYEPFHGHICQKCPAGQHVTSDCKLSGTPSECKACENDTYANHMNALKKCVPCTICRGLDEVELQPCTQTSDTQCACKNGTYCSPDLPCETCHKCTPRCPDGEMMVKPCTPTSNIQCLPDTTSPTPTTPATGSHGHIGWIIGCSLVVVAAAVVLSIKYRDRFSCCAEASPTGPTAVRWRFKTVQCLRRNCSQGQQDIEENAWNVRIDQASQQSSQSHTNSSTSEMLPLRETSLPEEELAPEEKRNLVPANGKDPTHALRQCFDIFVSEVPVKGWNKYIRALGLTENEIDIAKLNNPDINEQHFQMLRTWLLKNGRQATLNVLLETLLKIGYKGIEQIIRTRLISDGLYVYEE
ncbi:tumor necrosis factor receptor superfamily member 10B-like [Elgaria multicarinata webbii]|uniref:tumor necrosis factor receptor superfamily member 10B-like n=1 Tax=Elgaria multicarinata webbii TaxID=159646 RepID=UPI002FCCD7BB